MNLRLIFAVLVTPSVLAADAEGFLPHHGRRVFKRTHPAKELLEVRAPVVTEKAKIEQEIPSKQMEKTSLDATSTVDSPVVQQLHGELVEMKHHHAQIGQLREALKADTALLRETTMLKKSSQNGEARASAETQMRKATQLVKSTEEMLHEVKSAAAASSELMLKQATGVRQAVDALTAEATEQARLFGHEEFVLKEEAKAVEIDAPAEKPSLKVSLPKKSGLEAAAKATDKDDDLDLEDIEDEN